MCLCIILVFVFIWCMDFDCLVRIFGVFFGFIYLSERVYFVREVIVKIL